MSRDAGLTSLQALEQHEKFTLYFLNTEGVVVSYWGTVPSFTDASASSNIHLYGGDALLADFDNNQTEDLITSAFTSFPDRIYSNRGDGFFTEMTNQLHTINTPLATANRLADVDNNGFVDVYQTQSPARDVWYRNFGSWKFEPMASPVTFPTLDGRCVSKFADMDCDGDLDVVYMQSQASEVQWPFAIFTNDGIGNFSPPRTIGRPIAAGAITYSFFVANLNDDNIPDLFKFNLGDKCELYFYNSGEVRDTATWAGADGTFFATSPNITWAAPIDINHDGSLDIFMVSRTGQAAFFLNNGRGKFTPANSLAFDPRGENPMGNFTDIDCDGDMDLFLVDRFYQNNNEAFSEYREVSFRQTSFPTLSDFDNDGDPDIITSAYRDNGRLYVLKNELNPSNAVRISVNGIRSNSFGIGTRVNLWKYHNAGKELVDVREVASPGPLSFYVDSTDRYDVEVTFPSGIEAHLTSIQPGSYEVSEFTFPMNHVWDFYYSLQRSWKYTNGTLEIVKLGIFFGMLIIAFRVSKKFKTDRYVRHPLFITGMLFLYILTIHATVRNGMVMATILPLGIVFLVNAGWVATARNFVLRREANYVSHFRLLELLGEGGMGKVYKAADSITKNIVAVKVLNPAIMKDVENRKRLRNEGNLLSSFSHPHIVKVFEVGETETQSFIAMEYLPGGTLRQHLEKTYPLPIQELGRIFLQICDGVSEIHSRDIVHRDLKTGNIMLDDKHDIRIMDFGLSKSPLVTTMTTLGTVIGTLGYVSPEQVTSMNVDRRADIFSLGVVLYELVTNQLPFKGENEIAVIHSIFNTIPPAPSTLTTDIPSSLDEIIATCLQKNPDDRYQSVADLRIALEKEFC
jgi:tRNA A-37 threonylcarbamoyl transferase component Bud32